MIIFNFNKDKAIELILYFANKKCKIDKLTILKFLFFADIYHLNIYNRPILGGKYVAMKLGPVSSQLRDLIERGSSDFRIQGNTIIPSRSSDNDYFSKSDLEALEYAFNQYSQFSSVELSKISHEHKAWINARKREPHSNNPDIFYEDFFENLTEDKIIFLKENSHLMVI
ncbi:MAG: Panacea domain-containing protein [Candidatus Gastranaerophilales bacterium]|nr:Panacea domain-containing protein [Candidatus Gastranaerophilales bacterium]